MSSGDGGGRLVISSGNHEAYIVMTAVVGVIWTGLVLCIRMYLRLRLNGPFGLDDAAALVGSVRQYLFSCMSRDLSFIY